MTFASVSTGAPVTLANFSMNSTTSPIVHVAVGIGAFVTVARQPALPVWSQQPQRVPAFSPPRVGDVSPLEHDVVERPLAEEVAGGEAGMARTDDD